MRVYSILILNKAGGLIYQRDLNNGLAKLSANDYLVLAGTLHGVHAIAARVKLDSSAQPQEKSHINSSIIAAGKANSPNANHLGLQNIDTDLFSLHVFLTITGLKFIIVTSPPASDESVPSASGSGRGDLSRRYNLVSEYFHQLYILYCDYVMKDPFYSLDMPVKSAMFESKVTKLARG